MMLFSFIGWIIDVLLCSLFGLFLLVFVVGFISLGLLLLLV